MEANEFEKKIQSTMDEFALIPNEAVWENVASEIAVDKRRRRIIFWFFSSVLLLSIAAGSLWLRGDKEVPVTVNDKASSKDNSAIVSKKSLTNNQSHIAGIPLIVSSTTSMDENDITTEKTRSVGNTSVQSKPIHFAKQAAYNHGNKANRIRQGQVVNENQEIINIPQQPQKKADNHPSISMSNNGFKNPIPADEETIKSKINNSAMKVKAMAKSDSISQNNEPKIASASSTKDDNKLDKKRQVKWKFGFSLYGGYSNNISGLPFVNKNAADERYSNTSGVVGLNSNGPLLQYFGGFSYGLGAFIQMPLKNRLSFAVGANYHLYTATSKVGTPVQNQLNVYDSALQINHTGSEYYTAGQSTRFTNRYHLIEFPLQFNYKIGRSKDRAVVLTAGITPGMLISSTALYANRNKGVYYVEKQQFNKVQLGTQIGLLFTLKSTAKYQLQIGPVAQYSFTNLTKSVVYSNQHLLFTGIKTSFSFK